LLYQDELLIVLAPALRRGAAQLMENWNGSAARNRWSARGSDGYSFNLDGTNIYMTLATLFIGRRSASISPSPATDILVVAMLTSKARAA